MTVDAKDAPKRLPYYPDESFRTVITRGAQAIARRGAGRFVLCGEHYTGYTERQRHLTRRIGGHVDDRLESVKTPRFHCDGHNRRPESLEFELRQTDCDVEQTYKALRAALRQNPE